MAPSSKGIAGALLAVALAFPPALAQAPAEAKEPNFFVYTFDGHARHLKQLYDSGDLAGFLRYHTANATELAGKAPKFDFWYVNIVRRYNAEFEKSVDSVALTAAMLLSTEAFPVAKWALAKDICRTVASLDDGYTSFALLREPRFLSPRLKVLDELQARLAEYLGRHREEAFNAYLASPSGGSFFEVYPLMDPSKEKAYYMEHFTQLLGHAARAGGVEVDPLFPVLQQALEPADLIRYIENANQLDGQNMYWNEFSRLLYFLNDHGAGPELLRKLFNRYTAVYLATKPGRPADFPVNCEEFQPVPVDFGKDVAYRFPSGNEGKFIVILANLSTRATHQQVEQRAVSSRFVSGHHDEHNPEYDAAVARVESAEAAYNYALRQQQQMAAQTNSNSGLAGLLGNVLSTGTSVYAATELSKARSALDRTPSEIQQPDYADYTYTTTRVGVHRQLEMTLYFKQPGTRGVFKTPIKRDFDQEFKFVYDLNGADPDANAIVAGFQNEDDLDYAEKNPMLLNMAAIIDLLGAESWVPVPEKELAAEVPALLRADPPAKSGPAAKPKAAKKN